MDPELLKKYRALDRKTRDFLFSKKVLYDLIDIAEENNISEDQASSIANQIILIVLGSQTKEGFVEELEKIGLDKNGAKLVAEEIDTKILSQANSTKKDTEQEIEISRKITPRLQQFIDGGEWRNGVGKVARQFNLKEDQIKKIEEQTLLILNCTEMPSAFKENIKREAGLDENAGRRIADSINGSVFANIMGEIKAAWAGQAPEKEEFKPADNLDELMIQKAMRPAGTAPANLPTGETQTEPKVVHDYMKGNDPYREPME